MVYPSNAPPHSEMAQQSPTPIVSLVDVLAMTDKVDESRLVQLLAKLETAQIVIALVKSLNLEEDKVCEVDETAILRLDATKACLGPALSDLQKASREFTQFLANVPIADSQVFIPYKFAETSLKLQSIYDTELMKAVGRWHFALQAVCGQIQEVTPEEWKSKAIDSFDQPFVKSKILNKDLVSKLGTDYLVASAWLTSADKIGVVFTAFQTHHEDDYKQWQKVLGETRDLVAAILMYNVMIHKFPGTANACEKRQAVKDVKKKIRSKFGDKYEVPEAIMNRVQTAINQK